SAVSRFFFSSRRRHTRFSRDWSSDVCSSDLTPTRGRGWARTSPTPSDASTPMRAGVSSSPGPNSRSPGRRSSPGARTWSPGRASTSIRTARPPSSRSVRSTMTTASAPSGSGAPVKMRTASPGPSGRSAGCPAATSATTGSTTGAPAVSAARTAYPSIAVLAKGGTASVATTSPARTSPAAAASGTVRGGSGSHPATTWATASSRGITARSDVAPAAGHLGGVGRELGAEVLAVGRQLDRGPQVVDLLADVEAALVEDVPVDGLLGEQDGDGVGELDLAADARLGPV